MITPNQQKEFQHLGEPEPALIRGRLVEVDPKHGTAILEAYMDSRVPLRFDASLEQEMLNLERNYVRVEGYGWISDEDHWIAVVIDEIAPPPPPRTIEEILNDPDPKLFDPDTIPRASEPFDVDEFLRVIYEGRGRTWNG